MICFICSFLSLSILIENSDSEDQHTIMKKNVRRAKSNPNIQCTKNLEKKQKIHDEEIESDNEDFRVTYKSNKTAVPVGPSDQGATATVVRQLKINFILKFIE